MQLRNQFKVPLPPDEAFTLLLDFERVAACMPGAELTDRDGDRYQGALSLRVGAATADVRGSVVVEEVDRDRRRARLSASGSQEGGQSGVEVQLTAEITGDDSGSVVTAVTDLQLSGDEGPFERHRLVEVSQRLTDQFAANLEALALGTSGERAEPAPAPVSAMEPVAPTPSAAVTAQAGPTWLSVPAWLRRAAPAAATLLAGLLAGWMIRRRRRRRLLR